MLLELFVIGWFFLRFVMDDEVGAVMVEFYGGWSFYVFLLKINIKRLFGSEKVRDVRLKERLNK